MSVVSFAGVRRKAGTGCFSKELVEWEREVESSGLLLMTN